MVAIQSTMEDLKIAQDKINKYSNLEPYKLCLQNSLS
jgi:hypothetical protein